MFATPNLYVRGRGPTRAEARKRAIDWVRILSTTWLTTHAH